MFRLFVSAVFILVFVQSGLSQVNELPHQYITAPAIHLAYPVNAIDVRAIGMGNTQIANGTTFNAMMYNPALLDQERNSIEYFGIQAGMPSSTYEAADYLSQHIDEFEDAISLNQVWDGLEQLTQPGANNLQKLDALHEIQDGLIFVNDLFYKVTGPSENPKKYGISLLPGVSAQFGNLGFSLYAFGQAGFMMQLSPTFESLLDVDIPQTLQNPLAVARAVVQLRAALAPAIIGPRKFSDKVYPTALYVSYLDVVAAAGYGYTVNKNLTLGANLKIINRRFLLDKIPVKDYDEIISSVWDKFKSDVTGVTCDLGVHYKLANETAIAATFQNIIPMQEIRKTVDTQFRFHRIDNIDTLRYDTWEATVTRPFELKLPFIMSLGFYHPITDKWNVAFDWVDIAENDVRYKESMDRFRIGTEYRYNTIENTLIMTPRLGLADQQLTMGLGFEILKLIHIDGAYAYDRFVNKNVFYAQFKIIW